MNISSVDTNTDVSMNENNKNPWSMSGIFCTNFLVFPIEKLGFVL
jgi:hypothetical protein